MSDLISRQAAIEAVHRSVYDFFDICDDDEESPMTYKDELLLELNKAITTRIKAVASAQPIDAEPNTAIETVDWYHQNADGEMVLGANSGQQAWFKADDVFKALKAEPVKHGRWIEWDNYDGTYKCSVCGMDWDVLEGTPQDNGMYYCPNCGTLMDLDEVEK